MVRLNIREGVGAQRAGGHPVYQDIRHLIPRIRGHGEGSAIARIHRKDAGRADGSAISCRGAYGMILVAEGDMNRMVRVDVQEGVGGDRACGYAVYQHIFHLIPFGRGHHERQVVPFIRHDGAGWIDGSVLLCRGP